MSDVTTEVTRAEAITAGAPADVATVTELADTLRATGRTDVVTHLLVAISRRALYDRWERSGRVDLAHTLRDHEHFGYARRLLGRVRAEGDETEASRQQQAVCTYKDTQLPALLRLDWALQILVADREPGVEDSSETLGIAGAIYKRKWATEGKRADLERAQWCYEAAYASGDIAQRRHWGINAAFVGDQLALLGDHAMADTPAVQRLRERTDAIRRELVALPATPDDEWAQATLGEALLGLGDYDAAVSAFSAYHAATPELWRRESTTLRVAALAQLRGVPDAEAARVLRALAGDHQGALERASNGKLGLALSGGGFRASLYHIGVLARLAECGVLRHVEVLSCVSGGSILGAFYYLKLRTLLQSQTDAELSDDDYVTLVRELASEFLDGVRQDLRGQLTDNRTLDWRMFSSTYTRTDRAADLYEKLFYAPLRGRADPGRGWLMTDLPVAPAGEPGFVLRHDNWARTHKVPMLVLNATTLNTGHVWQFTAAWMGEAPNGIDEEDASHPLRRIFYSDLPAGVPAPSLSRAVAASACVPTLFSPMTFRGLYDGTDIELVDGGVHDNQGVASLLEQGCTMVLVSDASGQISDDDHPGRGMLSVANRSNSVLMSRVRGAQYAGLANLERAGVLDGLMIVHLKKGLPAPPRDWLGCQEPWVADDEPPALVGGVSGQRDYHIEPDVQLALARLRTDLDAFSDDEAYSLMAAGYAMSAYELQHSTLPWHTGPRHKWPFDDHLRRLGDPESAPELAATLAPGRSRFFRGLARRREPRLPRPPAGWPRGVGASRGTGNRTLDGGVPAAVQDGQVAPGDRRPWAALDVDPVAAAVVTLAAAMLSRRRSMRPAMFWALIRSRRPRSR